MEVHIFDGVIMVKLIDDTWDNFLKRHGYKPTLLGYQKPYKQDQLFTELLTTFGTLTSYDYVLKLLI